MPDISELKNLFHECMPLFIALGDEIRLSIIESLTDAAYRTCDGDFSSENLSRHGLNVREITDKTNLSRPAVSHHLKLLLPDHRPEHPAAYQAGHRAPVIPGHGYI